MDVATVRELSGRAGRALLAAVMDAYAPEDALALGSRLRREHPAHLVAAALTQAELRGRAAAKLPPGDAALMLFTRAGLEQATRAEVAAHRAARVAASGAGTVADLCCGIGADLVALARAGLRVTGVERDPVTAAVARANVEALGLAAGAGVVEADATRFDTTGYDAVTCDPSRRTARGRVFAPAAFSPGWDFVSGLLRGHACVKSAPGIPHEAVPRGVEAEWVSWHGEVKEAALWSGSLRGPTAVARRATLLPAGVTVTDRDAPPDPPAGGPGRYLLEPDGAVIRAGLVTAACAAADGWLLDPRIAYVGCDRPPGPAATALGRAYAVTEVLPYDVPKLRAWARRRGVGALTVKKRGVGVDPEALRRRLRPHGDTAATLVVTRVAGRATVLAVDPL